MAGKITLEMIDQARDLRNADPPLGWAQIAKTFGVSESGLRNAVKKDENKILAEYGNVVQLPVAEQSEGEAISFSRFDQSDTIKQPETPLLDATPEAHGPSIVVHGNDRGTCDVQVVAIDRSEASSIHSEINQAATVMGQGAFDPKEKLWVGLPVPSAEQIIQKYPYGAVVVDATTLQCKKCGNDWRMHGFPFAHKSRTAKDGTKLHAQDWQRDTSRCRFSCRPAEDVRNKGDRDLRRSGQLVEGRRFEHEQCRDATCEECKALVAKAQAIKAEGKAKGEAAHIMASEARRQEISAEVQAARAKYEGAISGGKTVTEAKAEVGLKEEDCEMCLGYGAIPNTETGEFVPCVGEAHKR